MNPNRQRDHQANERTFLAWLRTAIALIGFGFAIARFGLFLRQLEWAITQHERPVHPIFNSENLGLMLVLFGIGSILMAAWQYNRVFWQIEREDYEPNRRMIWIITVAVVIAGMLSIPLLRLRHTIQPPASPQDLNLNSQIYRGRSPQLHTIPSRLGQIRPGIRRDRLMSKQNAHASPRERSQHIRKRYYRMAFRL
jgi:putative membrane protein